MIMQFVLGLLFLFFIGCFAGWGMEVFYRRFCCRSTNPEHHWINPGFLTGPYLPLYGFGLILMYLICTIPWGISSAVWCAVVTVAAIALAMTLLEYVAGLIFVCHMKLKLWDYSENWGNIQGIICPFYSGIWAGCGAVYYFLIHPHIQQAMDWFGKNLAFSFVVGFFFGVFTIDLAYTTQIVRKIRAFAKENHLVVRYEGLKTYIKEQSVRQKQRVRQSFIFAFRTNESLTVHLERYIRQSGLLSGQRLEKRLRQLKKGEKRDEGED